MNTAAQDYFQRDRDGQIQFKTELFETALTIARHEGDIASISFYTRRLNDMKMAKENAALPLYTDTVEAGEDVPFPYITVTANEAPTYGRYIGLLGSKEALEDDQSARVGELSFEDHFLCQ